MIMHETVALRNIFNWMRHFVWRFNSNVAGDCKLVVLVRTDLNMGKGKIASSCSHAAVSCYVDASRKYPEIAKYWLATGQKKIILKWDRGESQLRDVASVAKRHKLTTALIRDAGRTQVEPGSVTALGIGPGRSEEIQKLVPGLKLL